LLLGYRGNNFGVKEVLFTMQVSFPRFTHIVSFLFLLLLLGVAAAQQPQAITKTVNVPEADQFIPFAITIHVGDSVQWVNHDEDDHTIVSDDALTTAGHRGTNHLLPGLENNAGQPGRFTLKFNSVGRFVYYCRFHSHLNGQHQPIAPGPDGGIQDSKGNFGTPMSGVVVVLPANE
jgi:plastocyanin